MGWIEIRDQYIGFERCFFDPRKARVEWNVLYNSKGQQSHEEFIALGKQGPNWGKNAEFYKFGRPRTRAGNRADVQMAYQMVLDGKSNSEIASFDFSLYARLYKAIDRVRSYIKPCRIDKPQIIVLVGPPECGKTRWAFDNYPDLWEPAIQMGKENWFDGYEGQKVGLLDEFEGMYLVW